MKGYPFLESLSYLILLSPNIVWFRQAVTNQDVAGVEEMSLCDHPGVTVAVTLPWSGFGQLQWADRSPLDSLHALLSHRPDFP